MGMKITEISSADYVQSTVARGDGSVPASVQDQGLTAYYTGEGNPPGRWIGAGLAGIDRSSGNSITSDEAIAVWQEFQHPDTGQVLGRKRAKSSGRASDANQLAESTKQTRKDVAGFDLTFTIPKDASVLWALGDPEVKEAITRAHNAALAATIEYMERHVLQTRAGHSGVAKVGARGIIAGQWDHWDSRDGDPHLHSHVVVSNKVQRASDGKWVTIDSRALFKNTVRLSEVHQNLFLDEMSRRLGVRWKERPYTAANAVVPEIEGFPRELRELFSSRDANISEIVAQRVKEFVAEHGREPSKSERHAIHDAAWRASRQPKPKVLAPLADKCELWRKQAVDAGFTIDEVFASSTGRDVRATLSATTRQSVHSVIATLAAQSLRARQIDGANSDTAVIAALADDVEDALVGRQSTWSRASVHAEVERMMRMVRASDPQVREQAASLIVEGVLARCIEIHPERYKVDVDDPRLTLRGVTVFDAGVASAYTSQRSLDREASLVEAATTTGVYTPVSSEVIDAGIARVNEEQEQVKGFTLAPDQEQAVRGILADSTRMSVLIGPAGTGKTTTMAALRNVWETEYGRGSVIGLTTSAQAAHVLEEETGSHATTIAKWLYETGAGNAERRRQLVMLTDQLARYDATSDNSAVVRAVRARITELTAEIDSWTLKPHSLVIIDEASMTSTVHLHSMLTQADAVGAKILTVGDHRQLDAVDAGGALALVAERASCHQLTSVWRFHHEWERAASLRLREVNDSDDARALIGEYDEHGRLEHGDDETMLEAAFTATYRAIENGKTAILIASTNQTVRDLNQRFTMQRRASGRVNTDMVVGLKGDETAGVGERILARHNQRRLTDSRGDFIRNGSILTITEIKTSGAAVATVEGTGARIVLPADYLAAHCELGYATTAHRSQGMTVDEAHLLIPEDDPIPAELLYVGMTRGRYTNKAYIGEHDTDDATATVKGRIIATEDTPTWDERLASMMQNSGAEQSATALMAGADDEMNNLGRLASEYEYLLTLEDTSHIVRALVEHHGLNPIDIDTSPVFASLAAAHRAARATAAGAALDELARPLTGERLDTDGVLRVLTSRQRTIAADNPRAGTALPVLLSDRADSSVRDLGEQVVERINSRRRHLRQQSLREPWARHLAPDLAYAIAEYRDLWAVKTTTPLGMEPNARDTRQHAAWSALHTQLHEMESREAPRKKVVATEQQIFADMPVGSQVRPRM